MKMMSGIAYCGLNFYSNLFYFGNYNDIGTLLFYYLSELTGAGHINRISSKS